MLGCLDSRLLYIQCDDGSHIFTAEEVPIQGNRGGGGRGGSEWGWDGSHVICLHLITHAHIKQDPYHTEHVRVVNLK